MQNINFGINLGLALRGLSSINVCSSSFNRLRRNIISVGESAKHLKKNLAGIRLNNLKIGNIENSMDDFKSKVIQKIALGASVVVPIKTAMDFESSMADVKKVVDFTSKAEFNKFSKDLLNLSRTIPLSANELATITASGGQLGIAKEDLMEFTAIVAKMGVAFNMSSAEAGDSIASMMNVFGIGISEVEKLGDTINHLSDNSASKAKDIVEAMKRIGGSTKVFGLSADEASALASSFISLGKPPQVAATAINALLNKLQTAPEQGEKFKEALAQIGMDAQYVKTMIANNPQKALETFLSSLEGVEKGKKMSILTNLFGDEYSDDMALLTSSLEEYRKALKRAKESAKSGSLDREFKNRSETTASSLQKLKNAVSEIGITFGSMFLPTLAKAFEWLAKLGGKLADFITDFPLLSKLIGAVVAGFVSFSVVLPAIGFAGSLIYINFLKLKNAFHLIRIASSLTLTNLLRLNLAQRIFNSLTMLGATVSKAYAFTLGLLSKAFAFLRTGILAGATAAKILRLALVSTGIGALVVGLGAAAAWLIENWDKTKEWFGSFSGWLKGIFDPVIDWFKNIFGGFFDWIGEKFAWIGDTISKITDIGSSITSGAKDMLGIGDGKESNWYNPFSWFNDEVKQPSKAVVPLNKPAPAMTAATASGVNVTFTGNFSLFSNDGKFDLESFKQQIAQGIKDALRKDSFNRANTDIRG